MATKELAPTERRRVIGLLAQRCNFHDQLQRENLLEDAGLQLVIPRLNFATDASSFAQQLVRELEQLGNPPELGQPALVLLLAALRERVRGHAEEVAFVDDLLRSYQGTRGVHNVSTSSTTPSTRTTAPSPVTTPQRSVPPVSTPTTPATKVSTEEARRAAAEKIAARQMAYLSIGALLLFLPLAVALVLWWAWLEPVTYIVGVILFLLSVLYYARTQRLPTIEELRKWLTHRAAQRLGNDYIADS